MLEWRPVEQSTVTGVGWRSSSTPTPRLSGTESIQYLGWRVYEGLCVCVYWVEGGALCMGCTGRKRWMEAERGILLCDWVEEGTRRGFLQWVDGLDGGGGITVYYFMWNEWREEHCEVERGCVEVVERTMAGYYSVWTG